MKKITVTLSDKAEEYFNYVKATIDRGEGDLMTQSEIISEILEVSADFERLTGGDIKKQETNHEKAIHHKLRPYRR